MVLFIVAIHHAMALPPFRPIPSPSQSDRSHLCSQGRAPVVQDSSPKTSIILGSVKNLEFSGTTLYASIWASLSHRFNTEHSQYINQEADKGA